jgi:hypothetical protein
VAAAALLYRLQPLLNETSVRGAHHIGDRYGGGGAALAVVAVRGAWQALPVAVTASAVALLLGVQFSVFAPAARGVERMAAFVAAHRAGGEAWAPTARSRGTWSSTPGPGRPTCSTRPARRASSASPDRVLLVLPERDLAEVAAAAQVEPASSRASATSTPRTCASAACSTRPGVELETMVLVANK